MIRRSRERPRRSSTQSVSPASRYPQLPWGLRTTAVPPLLVSQSGVTLSLPSARAPPVAVAFTTLSGLSHCALAVALVDATAFVVQASFDFASAAPPFCAKALALPRSVLQ